ncbi:ATP-grasp domain-containing protein, partial [Vibrio aquimaris]
FSSGKYIANILYEEGCELFHVISSDNLDDYYLKAFDCSIYVDNITHTDLEITSNYIKNNEIECVLAGTETGVELADELNRLFNFPYSNGSNRSKARRNKFEMIESLRQSGIRATKQIKSNCWHEINEWLNTQNYPVVAKPLNSAGSDSVFICNTIEDAEVAFSKIYDKTNKLNLRNEAVLFQEFLVGYEYVVNFVSLKKKFIVTEIVKYHKRQLNSGNIVYDIDEILDVTSPEFTALVEYTEKVCLSLEIENGPSHAEVMLTPDGPCLVEIAARSDGILRPSVAKKTTGLGQLACTALSITQPHTFAMKLEEGFYHLKKHSFNVCLIAPCDGKLRRKPFDLLLESLTSFHSVEYYVADGDHVSQTTDVFSQPATIYLVHQCKAQLWEDHNKIRNFELVGGYLDV